MKRKTKSFRKRITPIYGWCAVRPNGTLRIGWGGSPTDKEGARTNAAMGYNGSLKNGSSNSCMMPDDWRAAQRAGWRIAPVVLKSRKAK